MGSGKGNGQDELKKIGERTRKAGEQREMEDALVASK